MCKLLTILSLACMLASCSRKSIPVITNSDSTYIERKDSVSVKDTTITRPAREISATVNAESISSAVSALKMSGADTGVYTPLFAKKDSSLSAALSVNSQGKIKITCKEDSLRLVIRNLTTAFLELYISKNKTRTIEVPGPVVIQKVVPKWCWYLLVASVAFVGWKIAGLFISPGTTITDILKHWFTKWK